MQMTDLLPVEDWAALEKEIYERFGLNARVYDNKGFSFTGFTTWGNELCPKIKAQPKGVAGICSPAHQNIAAQAVSERGPVVECCDAGMAKICVPVFVGEEYVGVIGGCGRLRADDEIDSFMIEKAAGLPEDEVEAASSSVGPLDEAMIAQAVALMQAWADKAAKSR